MAFRYRENLFNWLSPGRVRWVEHPLEPLFLKYLSRGFGGVDAQLVHIERHPSKWVLGPQLLDEIGELIFIDGFRELHE